jgi:hypothetical protein
VLTRARRALLATPGLLAAVGGLLAATPGVAAATFDQVVASPDVDFDEEVPVLASATTAVGFFEIVSASATEGADVAAASTPATCHISVSNAFNGTRDRVTKGVRGTFTPVAKTVCDSAAVALYAVVSERKTVSVTTTIVKTAPPGSCQASTTPCAAATSNTSYACNPCNPASWTARSTHRLTLPSNQFFVDYPPSCTRISATIIECELTTARTTIK